MNDINTFQLKTDKIALRYLTDDDVYRLFALRSNESVNEYQDRPVHKNIGETKLFIEETRQQFASKETYLWVICPVASNELVGTVCLFNIDSDAQSGEVRYELFPEFQGKGLMQDALIMMIDYATSELGIKVLHAELDPANLKSVKLLERNGFKLEESLKDHEFFGGREKDTVTYFLRKA